MGCAWNWEDCVGGWKMLLRRGKSGVAVVKLENGTKQRNSQGMQKDNEQTGTVTAQNWSALCSSSKSVQFRKFSLLYLV